MHLKTFLGPSANLEILILLDTPTTVVTTFSVLFLNELYENCRWVTHLETLQYELVPPGKVDEIISYFN